MTERFRTVRWGWFLAAAAVAVVAVATWTGFANAPLPSPECDPNGVYADQVVHAVRFGGWLRAQLLLVAAGTVVLAALAFYFQLFHSTLGGFAAGARLGLVGVLGIVGGLVLVQMAVNWSARVSPSCLTMALQDSTTARLTTTSASWLPILGWPTGAYLDLLLMTIGAVALGALSYALLRVVTRL